MSNEEADLDETSRDEAGIPEDFWARFPPEAFEGVAEALGAPSEPKNLSALRFWLVPEFYFFFINCPGEEPTREEKIRQLEEQRDAATALLRSIRITGGLTRTLREVADGAGAEKREEFRVTLKRLADEADEKIQRLRSSRGRAGRPPKSAFRQLAADLVRVYERLTGEEAKEPQWKEGSKYGGDFYNFVIAVERCLRACLPEVREELPVSSGAIGYGLKNHWTSIREMAGEKPPPNKTQ